MSDRLRKAESIGRPLGDDAFVAELEKLSHRTLKPAKPGPKRAGRVCLDRDRRWISGSSAGCLPDVPIFSVM
jgi:hypothetical protein